MEVTSPRFKASPNSGARSLLQKAVRRGDLSIVDACINYLIDSGDKVWLQKRAPLIVFEECWPLGYLLAEPTSGDFRSILHQVCLAKKNKEAAGLGSLAYWGFDSPRTARVPMALAEEVEIILNGLVYPQKFWTAIKKAGSSQNESFIDGAQKAFNLAGWPWDKAIIMAGAYLSITDGGSRCDAAEKKIECPSWVAIDKHTPTGRNVLRDIANSLYVPYEQLALASFYYESATVNDISVGEWWRVDRECRFLSLGLSEPEAENLWCRVRSEYSSIVRKEAQELDRIISNLTQPKLGL